MARLNINIGNIVNDGLGDDLRTAFEKVNQNFTELYRFTTVNGVNIGLTGYSIFAGREETPTGVNLKFKKLQQGNGIILTDFPEGVRITGNPAPSFKSITTDSGEVTALTGEAITIRGAATNGSSFPDILVEKTTGTNIVVRSVYPLSDIVVNNFNFGTAIQTPTNMIELLMYFTNVDLGTVDAPSGLNLDFGTVSS
jgi:hypothetical protein